jgi:hypothetical protein
MAVVGAAAALAAALAPAPRAAAQIPVVDIIPRGASGEADQNSEPSLAVNPNDPTQAVVTAFTNSTLSPFFLTADGGASWGLFDRQPSFDSTLSWSASGALYLGRTSDLQFAADGTITRGTQEVDRTVDPATTGAPFRLVPGSSSTSPPGGQIPDQPRVVAARVGGVDHIYLAYNDFSPFNGQTPATGNTATVRFSTDGGATWNSCVVDRGNAGGFADGPAVRPAVHGNRVYVAFERGLAIDPVNGVGLAQVVVVRDDQGGGVGGPTAFTALGPDGATVATISAPFTSPLTGRQSLGQERIGADLSLAVDPRDPDHVYVAYAADRHDPAAGVIQVQVGESTDGGRTWSRRFATDATARFKAALPSLAVADTGAVGLLYTAQRLAAGQSVLETHFVLMGEDPDRDADTLLSRFTDGNPAPVFQPYIGDYEGLVAVGATFYGTFAASNQADGVHAQFPGGVRFQRAVVGTPGTPSFQLTDGRGNTVPPSIDPFAFQVGAAR